MSTSLPAPGRTRAVMRVGRPNAKPPSSIDAEAVDLADARAVGVDQRDVLAGSISCDAVAQPGRAPDASRRARARRPRARPSSRSASRRAEIGLAQRGRASSSTSSDSLPASSASRAACSISRADGRRDRTGCSPSRLAIEADQTGVGTLRSRRAVDVVLEIGQHLEVLAEVGVEGGQAGNRAGDRRTARP